MDVDYPQCGIQQKHEEDYAKQNCGRLRARPATAERCVSTCNIQRKDMWYRSMYPATPTRPA
jgi:hypothetical protein